MKYTGHSIAFQFNPTDTSTWGSLKVVTAHSFLLDLFEVLRDLDFFFFFFLLLDVEESDEVCEEDLDLRAFFDFFFALLPDRLLDLPDRLLDLLRDLRDLLLLRLLDLCDLLLLLDLLRDLFDFFLLAERLLDLRDFFLWLLLLLLPPPFLSLDPDLL